MKGTEKWSVKQAREYLAAKPFKPIKVKGKRTGAKAKAEIEIMLKLAGYDFVKEFRFDAKRKFRFDWAIESLKVGIEYEGLMSKKSRHTTVQGFTTDTEKYNLAQANGWKVLRYTALNYIQLIDDLKKMENGKQN